MVMLLPYMNPRLPLSESHAEIVIGRLVQAVAHTDNPAYCVTLDAVGDEQVTLTSLSQFCQNVPRINEA